ncbi:MAG: zinc ribbon domain-containing protein [Ktedonobacteraceae bacterium]
MEQRIYRGNIDLNALANYLVGIFNQQSMSYHHQPYSTAQKINQGERVYVQIMRSNDWSGREHGALSVQIDRIAGGVSIGMGQADWLDQDQGGLAGMLFGALFFPPLLLLPLMQGFAHSNFSQDVWVAIDTYCLQAPSRPARPNTPKGFYCSYCGAFNHPTAAHCHACRAPFTVTSPPQPEPPVAEEPAPESVVCQYCGATVAFVRFCGNCAAPLREESGQ